MKVVQPVMSPLDVVVLIKLALASESLSQVSLARDLVLSQSEISKSMARSRYAGLLFGKDNQVMRQGLFDFIQYGVKYAFPQQPGPVVRGVPTSHSAAPLSDHIQSDEPYVWPSAYGEVRGHAIAPLYPNVVEAVAKDPLLYEVLALVDALRVGRARERNIAGRRIEKADMLKNTLINRAVTKKIATAMGELNEQVVYVGGAVVSLYTDDPSADDVRPTKDLDLTLEIASLSALENLREELVRRGFKQAPDDSVVCRFRYEDILVDVMATIPIGWAPGNRWFELGFKQAYSYDLDGLNIRLLPLSYFLATKFDAFFDRGINDLYASHDFEDIVYLFNHVSDIAEQVVNSEKTVADYLRGCSEEILNSSEMQETIVGNLYHEDRDRRLELIMDKIKRIANEL